MKIKILLFTCFLLLIISCDKETALDQYYNQKGNFSGSIYEALDSTGLYNYFIHGVDSTDFANQLKNTLITVIAPSDNAFKAYFEKHGYNSLSGIPSQELQDLIGHHIITWPHSPSSFETDPNNFKRLTNMARRTIIKFDPILDIERNVVKQAKYLQFYFPEMLAYYGATEDDYKLFTGYELSQNTGFNIYDVAVDSIVPYGNGWVYYVDKVIEPYDNLDDWLGNSEEYSIFNKLYNRYSTYEVDASVYSGVPVKRSNVFQNNRGYRIDMELDYETVGSSSVRLQAGSGFTVVAPQNAALQSFIDTTFNNFPGFEEALYTLDKTSLENLHVHKIIRSIIFPYLFIDNMVFPSKFSSNEGINGFDGTNLKLSASDITEYKLCSNGFAYGINKFIVPRSFRSILKPSTTSPDFKYFLTAVFKAQIFSFLNTIDANYTLMLPTDSAFIKNNILLLPAQTYINDYGGTIANQYLEEDVFVEIDPVTGENPVKLEVQEIFDLVFNHLFTESVTPGAQKQFAPNAIGYFVGITQDSLWSGGNMEYRWTTGKPLLPKILESITDADNGRVFVVNDLIKSPAYTLGRMLLTNPAYSRFKDLCQNAGLLSNSGVLNVIGNYPTVFVPTNDAIDQFIADGKLPADEEELKLFIKYFFVDKSVFTTASINETTVTLCKDIELSTEFTIVYKTVELSGSPGSLKIKGKNNPAFLNVIEGMESNTICKNGIIHLVDGVLN